MPDEIDRFGDVLLQLEEAQRQGLIERLNAETRKKFQNEREKKNVALSVCLECGEQIEKEVLLLNPEAPFCIGCNKKHNERAANSPRVSYRPVRQIQPRLLKPNPRSLSGSVTRCTRVVA